MNLKLKIYNWFSHIPCVEWGLTSLRDYYSLVRNTKRGTFSQHGEDVFLENYFGRIVGSYIDIGASHPFRISNTYLLYKRGWSGVTVEPIEHLITKHQRWRSRDQQCCEAVGAEEGELTFYELVPSVLSTFDKVSAMASIRTGGVLRRQRKVKVTTLKSIRERFFPGRQVELLSVDAEGLDFTILSGNDWSEFRPKIVIFEANNEGKNQAEELLLNAGYRFLKTLGCNQLYERID